MPELTVPTGVRKITIGEMWFVRRSNYRDGARSWLIILATAAGRFQVGVTSRRPAAAPARDAGLTGFAAEGAKSAEAAQGHDDCSDDGRKGDYSKHAGKDDYSKDGKGDYSKHDGGWKDAKNDDCQPQKDCCDPKPSDDCGKGVTYRNPGEALAKFDFSHGDFGSHGPDHSGDMLRSNTPSAGRTRKQ